MVKTKPTKVEERGGSEQKTQKEKGCDRGGKRKPKDEACLYLSRIWKGNQREVKIKRCEASGSWDGERPLLPNVKRASLVVDRLGANQ